MDDTQRSHGASATVRYRAILTMSCPQHAEGHKMTSYSRGTDDAWWLTETFAGFCASKGYACRVRFEKSSDGTAWETVPPHEAVPDEPVF